MRYVLERDMGIQIVGGVDDPDDTGLVSRFTRGTAIPADDAPRRLDVTIEHAPEEYPDYFELQQIPVVSDRFLSALRLAGVDNVAAYAVELHEADRRVSGYSVLNIVGRIACIDLDRSDCIRFGRSIARIQKLVLAADTQAEMKMFRAHEFQYLSLVDGTVHDAVVGMLGVVVTPADGWSDGHRY
jgi:hypothetical protein